jgi:DNA-binding transcriptional LysR family regulator
LQQRHPGLEIEMRLEERMVNLAAEGVDLAVLPEPFIPSGNVVARHLTRSQMVLCASPAYLAGAACLNGPAELAAHACIGFNHGPMLRRWSLFHRGQRVEVPVRCVFCVQPAAIDHRGLPSGAGRGLAAGEPGA